MDADERDICIYLKSLVGQFISGREIARRAGGKRRYQNEPDWAVPVLSRLVEKGLVEDDMNGHFKLNKKEKKPEGPKKFVSPQIRKMLEASGKQFDLGTVEEEEEF